MGKTFKVYETTLFGASLEKEYVLITSSTTHDDIPMRLIRNEGAIVFRQSGS